MILKEFINLDDWNDSHVGYAFKGFMNNKYINVTHITLEDISKDSEIHIYAFVLHLCDNNSRIISAKPCPDDLLSYARVFNRIDEYLMLFEKDGVFYNFNKPHMMDETYTLCINGIDEEIAFDVGEKYKI